MKQQLLVYVIWMIGFQLRETASYPDENTVDSKEQQAFNENHLLGSLHQLQEMSSNIIKSIGGIAEKIENIEADIGNMRADIENVKEDIGNVKSRIGNVKSGIGIVEARIGNMKSDIGNVKEDIAIVKSDIGNVKIEFCNKERKIVNSTNLAMQYEDTVLACEGNNVVLQCTAGKTVNIISANYGRTEPGTTVCPHQNIRTAQCYSSNSKSKAVERCQGKPNCELEASNSLFGDPCQNTYKYLVVKFNCV